MTITIQDQIDEQRFVQVAKEAGVADVEEFVRRLHSLRLIQPLKDRDLQSFPLPEIRQQINILKQQSYESYLHDRVVILQSEHFQQLTQLLLALEEAFTKTQTVAREPITIPHESVGVPTEKPRRKIRRRLMSNGGGTEVPTSPSEEPEARERFFATLDRFKAQFQDIAPDELQQMIDDSIAEVAEERRRERATPDAGRS